MALTAFPIPTTPLASKGTEIAAALDLAIGTGWRLGGTPAVAAPLAPASAGVVGVGTNYAREDHKHPFQTPSADVGNAITVGSDGKHYATTGGAPATVAPVGPALAAVLGVSAKYAREDHKHAYQGVSADAGNGITLGSDGLHFAAVASPATVAPLAPALAGVLGVSLLYARQDHKHPYQPVSTDAGNVITLGTDGLHLFAGWDRVFLSNTAVAPATAGTPSIAEITAAAGANRNVILYYNGTNVAGTAPTYVYHIDKSGAVTLLRSPSTAPNYINFTVTDATPLSSFIGNAGVNMAFDTDIGSAVNIGTGAGVVNIGHLANGGVTITGGFALDLIGGPSANLQMGMNITTGNANLMNDQTTGGIYVGGSAATGIIKIGQSNVSQNIEIGSLTTGTISIGAGISSGKNIAIGSPNPAATGFTAVSAGTGGLILTCENTGIILGTATPIKLAGNTPGVAGQVVTSQGPGLTPVWAAAGKDSLFLTNTVVAPVTAGSPTLAEITTAAGANRDTILRYNGTNVDGVPTRVYWIDKSGTVTPLIYPGPAGYTNITINDTVTPSIVSNGTLPFAIDTSGAAALSLGTTNATSVALGGSASTVTQISAAPNGSITVGAGATGGAIAIGGASQTGVITLGSSTAAQTVSIGNGTGASTVNIANANGPGNVNIGTGTGAKGIVIGNTTGTGNTTINFGGGGLNIVGAANAAATIASGITTGSVAIADLLTTGSFTAGASMTSGAVNLFTNNGQTGALNIGTGNGNKIINLGPTAVPPSTQQTRVQGAVVFLTSLVGNVVLDAGAGTIQIGAQAATSVNVGNAVTTGQISIGTVQTSGSLVLGVTTKTGQTVIHGGTTNPLLLTTNQAAQGVQIRQNSTPGAGVPVLQFLNNAGTVSGSVTQNNAGGTNLLYNTTSDRRLKENFRPTRFGLADLLKVNVLDYDWRNDGGKDDTGMIAQDVADVYPAAVTKSDDGLGEAAPDIPWQVDYSKFVPLLIKSVQDLTEQVEALMKRLAVLES